MEQTCDHVIIISKGRVVAKDSVQHLTSRLAGQEQVSLEVAPREGALDAASVRQRLEQVAGVSRVVHRDTRFERLLFDVESLPGQNVRGDLARAVVESGWDLNELRPTAVSLEEVFLELTATDPSMSAPAPEGAAQ